MSFLSIPLEDGTTKIIPKSKIMEVTRDKKGVLVQYQVSRSFALVRTTASFTELEQALKSVVVKKGKK